MEGKVKGCQDLEIIQAGKMEGKIRIRGCQGLGTIQMEVVRAWGHRQVRWRRRQGPGDHTGW
jgi:hypothetical protein